MIHFIVIYRRNSRKNSGISSYVIKKNVVLMNLLLLQSPLSTEQHRELCIHKYVTHLCVNKSTNGFIVFHMDTGAF